MSLFGILSAIAIIILASAWVKIVDERRRGMRQSPGGASVPMASDRWSEMADDLVSIDFQHSATVPIGQGEALGSGGLGADSPVDTCGDISDWGGGD